MVQKNNKIKVILIVILVVGISSLHYGTDLSQRYLQIFYRELYLLPIILAAFWFGLRGALATSLTITALFLPFTLAHWQNFSPEDFSLAMDKLLYNIVAVILGVLKDRERAQHNRLLEAKSLAAIGKALSGVAHDIRTPLIAIGGFTRLVQKKLKEDDPDREKLDIVIGQTQRLENMVRQMLDFSRPLELNRSHEDLNQIVQESLSLVAGEAQKRKVKIESRLSQDIPAVALDAMRMEQVIINLLTNALQASPEGETVIVSTSREGRNIIVDVADCGCGIPPDQRAEIFHTFFTTKKEGIGLGLAIVKKIVKAHGGHLEVLDNPEKGVTFRVILFRG